MRKKPAHILQVVESEEFEANIRLYASKSSDEWKFTVLERLAYYVLTDHSDLVTANVVYHRNCRVNFANCSVGIPKLFAYTSAKHIATRTDVALDHRSIN